MIPNVYSEIRKTITDCIDRGEVHTVSSYVDRIMADHPSIEGADADFYLICARAIIKDLASKVIGKFNPKGEQADEQLVLEGFKHLQIACTVQRGGSTVLVPIDQLTDIELINRRNEFAAMREGLAAHIREIDEYLSLRAAQAA